MTAAAAAATVRFEGLSKGTDLWAATQANFIVSRPGHHAKETSVLLTDAGAKFLADMLGTADTPEFRAGAANHVGQLWVERAAKKSGPIESVMQLSRNSLGQDLAFLESVRAMIGRLTTAAPDAGR